MPKTVEIRLVCEDKETLLHIRERIVSALREQGDFDADIKTPRKGRGDDYLSYGTIYPVVAITRAIAANPDELGLIINAESEEKREAMLRERRAEAGDGEP